jgi:dTDP-4-amino-4,6-dideoxygalactose transaminase
VVAHAVVLSHNTPVFVDINSQNFNPSINLLCNAITPKTRFVILSHTFGFPQDSKAMENEIKKYEKRYQHKIWLINDCAHSFDAKINDNRIMEYGDATIFGLNISKTITSIFGGITATNNLYLAEKISRFNKQMIKKGSIKREIYQRLYILMAYIGFKSVPYYITQLLIRKTKLLSRLTDSYHLDGMIHFPNDHNMPLTRISAQVGCRQLKKYDQVILNRIKNSKIYESELIKSKLIKKPKIIKGSTFSHYPIIVGDKSAIIENMLRKGVECGEIIQYSIPELDSYRKYVNKEFPFAGLASRSVINLPINYSQKQTQHICELFNQVISSLISSKNTK